MLRMIQGPACSGVSWLFVVGLLGLIGLGGCQDLGPKWEIAAENQSDAECTVVVELAGSLHREARAEALAPGGQQVLLSASDKVIVRIVKLRWKGQDQEIRRNIEVPPGKRFQITVGPEGSLQTSLVDR